jgi:hypothetical protein
VTLPVLLWQTEANSMQSLILPHIRLHLQY